MSRESWIAEYYPVRAEDTTPEQALDHSILKWTGLQDKNLQRHGVDSDDYDDIPIDVSGETCALCVHFYSAAPIPESQCVKCPLAISLGRPCDVGDESPWQKWSGTDNAEPMLEALLKAKKNGPPPTDPGGNTKEQK